jgi:acetoin utilization deacetylase AcuC-like enzyme
VGTVLVLSHPECRGHEPGADHPESPSRLDAVRVALEAPALALSIEHVAARQATVAELGLVHRPEYVAAVRELCASGGGMLDVETSVSPGSWDAALRAAGAGLEAVERLRSGVADCAFAAVRPPGHHAHPERGMGFCVFNNLAVTAQQLLDQGERVLVVDYDAHHGDGTQSIFWDEPRLLMVSLHQGPGLFPVSGEASETGGPNAPMTILNFAFPPLATGDVFLRALDEVAAPVVERFDPTYVLVSAGFDGHRDEPLSDLALTSGDFGLMAERVRRFAPGPGRLVLFLEGGYEFDALRHSVGATVATLAEVPLEFEAPSVGGPGNDVVDAVATRWLG